MAFDAFLKIGDIVGESTDSKHKGEIEVLSFSWGATQPGVAAGQPVSRNAKVSLSDITILKKVDVASAQLMLQSCGGGAFPSATLTVRKLTDGNAGAQEFLKVSLSDVVITGVSAGGNSQTDAHPLEQISLNFSKIELAVTSDTGQTVNGFCGSAFHK